jgi:hypothetical protein
MSETHDQGRYSVEDMPSSVHVMPDVEYGSGEVPDVSLDCLTSAAIALW